MTVSWTITATESLKKHYNFFKSKEGVKSARKFRKKIFDKVDILKSFPRIGIEEKSIFYKDKEYRSMMNVHHKIIYRIEEEEIKIIDVFDTRQNPDKLIF